MKKRYLKIVVALTCVSAFAGCAAPKESPRAEVLTSDRIQQVSTAAGPKFVDCAIAHCPTRTLKSIGGDESEIRIEAPTVKPTQAHVEPKLEKPAVVEKPGGERLMKSVTVHFKLNSADLGSNEKASLNALAPILKDAKRVRVVGRTDGTGAGAANDRLANKRAMNVMLYLRDVANGAHDNKVELSSKGMCCYVADNETNMGRSMNRRAEVQVYGELATQEQHKN